MDNITADMDLEEIASACVNRPVGTLFALGDERHSEFIRLCHDSVVLMTGAAGFIARKTLNHVLDARPRAVYLVDSSENGLAALARKLATTREPDHPTEVHMILSDITSPLIDRALAQTGSIDLVLHFAAVKHVRSERDPASALRIFDVNILGTQRLLTSLAGTSEPPRVFAVSTDKAVRPTSMMGASKAVMEALLWQYPGAATSARFANVLFSSGSITESWVDRLGRREPLSSPSGTFRFFVSPAEAGLICASAATAPGGSIAIPDSAALQPIDLLDLAHRFLGYFGRTPVAVPLEAWQRDPAVADPARFPDDLYPLVVTPRDTTGEKEQEEFADPDESPSAWTEDLSLIRDHQVRELGDLLEQLSQWAHDSSVPVTLDRLRTEIGRVLPGFRGTTSEVSLDSRI